MPSGKTGKGKKDKAKPTAETGMALAPESESGTGPGCATLGVILATGFPLRPRRGRADPSAGTSRPLG